MRGIRRKRERRQTVMEILPPRRFILEQELQRWQRVVEASAEKLS
jgi:hypothetical protein